MENIRLCFGTLANVLKEFMVPDQTQNNFISDLISGIDENSKYIGNEPSITKLLKFKINFNLSDETTEPSYNAVKSAISDIAESNIREDGKKMIILTLLDIIRKDRSLEVENKELFAEYFYQYKDAIIMTSEIDFLDFVTMALLYTTFGRVKNKYEGNVMPIINEQYINSVIFPYLSNVEWDGNKLYLTFLEIFDKFTQDLKKYNIYDAIIKPDPIYEVNGDFFEVFDNYWEYVSNNEMYTLYKPSYIMEKITLFNHKLYEYVDYLARNLTPEFEYKIKNLNDNINSTDTEYKSPKIEYTARREYARSVPCERHISVMNANNMRQEVADIYNEILRYVNFEITTC